MTGVTQTKRKAILREMVKHPNAVPYERIVQLASKFIITHIMVRNVLTQAGYQCLMPDDYRPPATPVQPKPRVTRPTLPLTREEHAIIRSCRLYRAIDDDSDYVIVRRDLFQRERAIILKLLDHFDMPKEGNT